MSAPQGLFAVHKPAGISSAEVIRHVQGVFRTHAFFKDSLAEQEAARGRRQNRRRRNAFDVKMGHGGTLDPLATGVLVIGIGKGTKKLSDFIRCTKTYEAVMMFGAGTDTYDAAGKVLKRVPYAHVTRERVEGVLGMFRGDILQKPPIFSALHHEGKRYYEYAREGKPLPIEIKARPVTAHAIDLTGFTREHEYKFPTKEASIEEKVVSDSMEKTLGEMSKKRELDSVGEGEEASKKVKLDGCTDVGGESAEKDTEEAAADQDGGENPPIASLRMSVSSGFYVRSVVHDIGEAVGSAAHMVNLVRTQQGQFELGKNVIPWEDMIDNDTNKWESQFQSNLVSVEEAPSRNNTNVNSEEPKVDNATNGEMRQS